LDTPFQSEFPTGEGSSLSLAPNAVSAASTVSNVAWPPSRPRPRVLDFSVARCLAVSLADPARRCQAKPVCLSLVRIGRPTRSPRHRRSQSYIVASSEDHETSACVLATYPVAASTSARAAAWSAPAGGRVAFVRCLLFTRSRALTSKAVVVPDLAWQMARCSIAHSLVHFN